MQLFLGIDGGGTGCRAAVCEASGKILGVGASGPANVLSDPAGALTSILAAAAQALAECGADAGDVSAVLGLAGANVGETIAPIRAGLPFGRVRIETDALIALIGAHHGQDGVAATLGTGSVYASQRGGVVRMTGGWGLVLGDEGSGAWIGRAALSALVQATDGLIGMSPMLATLNAAIGGAEAAVSFAHDASPAAFALHARAVIMAPEDPVSSDILARAEVQIARAIDHLQGSAPVPLAFLGGLGRFYAARFAARYGGVIRDPFGTALDGALFLARQG